MSLLQSIKINANHPDTGKPTLTKNEQDYYIKEVEFLITGERFSREDIKKDIQAGAADISDIGN